MIYSQVPPCCIFINLSSTDLITKYVPIIFDGNRNGHVERSGRALRMGYLLSEGLDYKNNTIGLCAFCFSLFPLTFL